MFGNLMFDVALPTLLAAQVNFTLPGVLVIVGSIVIALLLVILVSLGLSRVRARRDLADNAADQLRTLGLSLIPGILSQYAQGDYPEACRKLRDLLQMFRDPKKLLAELETAVWNVITALLKDPESRRATAEKFLKLLKATEQAPVQLPPLPDVGQLAQPLQQTSGVFAPSGASNGLG
ncbi:MAG: hypothetical protein JNG90_08305 [Planctomycetaceae bacterium]|nr:hypothetical protein [Planctomycetaceae bacterium]